MGDYTDQAVLIAFIGATSAIVAAFAKPICSTLFDDEGQPRRRRWPATRREPITPTPSVPSIEGAWKQYVLVRGRAGVPGHVCRVEFHGE